jgi:hypothetical protein
MEELPQQWKESIIVPIYKNGDKTDFSNYRRLSLSIQNGSGAHPASYAMDTRGSFPGGKTAGA